MAKAIQIQNLSKKYMLHHEGAAANATLVETLTKAGKGLCKRILNPFVPNRSSKSSDESFWALKDISLNIEEGDRVGIIGRNGAGKSTLLKILSRITEPTSGTVKIHGRLSALLEVGTGFHPELTGRENIFLNGAILGMGRGEIQRKFDEIVEFAEIEKFLDTPVKRYSSGMYMRLGFAIAAHLESDIMIIDEVLAVGDAQFQAKCFKKLDHLGTNGRTVLFVSHDTNSVLSLCNKGIYLENGEVKESGPIDACVNAYAQRNKEQSFTWSGVSGDEHIKIYSATVEHESNTLFYQHETPTLSVEYEVLKPHPDLFLSVGIWNMRNQLLARSQTFDDAHHHEKFTAQGRRKLRFKLNASLFNAGEYLIKLHCAIHNVKPISDETIILRFPVYTQNANTRFGHSLDMDGVHLGSHWQWENL